MTKQTKATKLSLQRESIRTLSSTDLGQVAGGSFSTLRVVTVGLTSVTSSSLQGGGTYTPSSSQ
jgi:hypothetical protein